MPRFYYSHAHKAFVKQCSCCKELFIGVDDREESLVIFAETFSVSSGAGMADGMQSRCYTCNASKRRALGVTPADLKQLWLTQGGKCSICANPISITRGATDCANVDHDEATGKVRELLCGNCNRGIGLFRHKSNLLRAAAAYCERHTVVIPLKRRA